VSLGARTTSALRLPPEDRTRSPHTGWTREHWAALADHLLLCARPHASPGHALLTFPGPPGGYGTAVDGLEGFARTFMAAAFRLAGDDGRDPLGLADWYAAGLAAGTDPRSPERWVRPDEHGQAKVEAAALALGLHLTRRWIWDRLTGEVQANVVDYLGTVVGKRYPPINWVWFQTVVEQFLRSVGGPYDAADVERNLDLHETFVRDDGWYADGAERAFDHYSGWALHLYPILWLEMAGDDPLAVARAAAYRARLDRYLLDAVRLVGADGSPLLQGRSLIYRFAAASPLWAGALSGTTAVSPGRLRRAASGIARHFVDHGAPDERGILTLGWHREWRPMAQSYSGPGSPYWASKGLLGLALPADHAVWAATEEPLPVERADTLATIAAPGWLVAGTRADGVVRVINHGTDHAIPRSLATDAPLYARLGYSTATSSLLSGPGAEDPLDQSVVLLDAGGHASHRTGFETLALRVVGTGDDAAGVGASRARVHWAGADPAAPDHGSGRAGTARLGAWLTTVSVVRGPWEVRLVRVDAAPDADVAVGRLRVGGWPVPATAPDGLVSSVLPVELPGEAGFDLAGLDEAADATPLAARTTTPWVATGSPADLGRWYAALVFLAGPGTDPTPPSATIRGPRGAETLDVAWPGAATSVDLSFAVS
jgi:hypothetical protein